MFGMTSRNTILANQIKDFQASQKRNWMLSGDKYYKCENDILNRKIMVNSEGGRVEDKTKSNNRLVHGFMKKLTDEKVAYLLQKEHSLKCEDEAHVDKVKHVLKTKVFQYTLSQLGYEASNKGISWLQVHINERNEFKYMLIPSEQCIPTWSDATHTELDAMTRVYEKIIWDKGDKKQLTKVEHWTSEGVEYFILDGEKLRVDHEIVEDGPFGHYTKNGENAGWGKVPFIPFKNNHIEYPDIQFVKSLVDNYDLSRSEAANFIEDVRNLIFILKGYGGESMEVFMQDLKEKGAISVQEDGGVETLNPNLDITAALNHYEQLKRDISEFGQGVNKDLDKMGASPSGVALKFLYSGLDLKCNALEVEFAKGFEMLLYFVNVFLEETGQGATCTDIDIVFNRDIAINETEAIDNCIKSMSVISEETVIAQHPWVKDVELEIERLKEARKRQEDIYKDKAPLPPGEE